MKNPLLDKFEAPFETAPFNQIKTEHFLPAIQKSIELAKDEVKAIKASPLPTFENTIEALDRAGEKLGVIAGIFFNLNSAETNEEIQKLAREISPLLTEHSNDILLDKELFERVEQVHSQKEQLNLSPEQETLLSKTYKSFVRNGANLNEEDSQKLRKIDQELAQLSLKFGEHVLAETNRYVRFVENESEVEGLPESIKEAAAQTAEEKGKAGQLAFTLDYPSYVPALTYLKNRELRKELFIAYNTKSSKGDELDNKSVIKDILQLRYERAKLLGYQSHAYFVLEERMAKTPKEVLEFLENLLEKAKPKAKEDVSEVAAFAKKLDGIERLE
ncbi:MAG: M3 family metallopeptidase, partial [Cyclobacteriaceae bacterium]|nr:M3 family metallopeptidase [Cyclobacteriaceae bacterium]